MYDYLIIGQGLSGSILALTLLDRGHRLMVIDNPALSASSRIAAGLVNPLVFRRFTKAWRVDELIPFLEFFYSQKSALLGAELYQRLPMLKPYGSEEEKNQWNRVQPDLLPYITSGDRHIDDPKVINPHGCLEINHSGWLNTPLFLDSVRHYLREQNAYRAGSFSHSDLQISNDAVTYQDIRAAKVIFCEGFLAAQQNPWFREVPFRLTKGEVLEAEVPGWQIDYILNRGVFLLPLPGGRFRLGATYRWKDFNHEVTEEAKSELLEKAAAYCRAGIQVTGQQAGVRPTVADRRPLIGMHPQHPRLAIFNGMGSKAVMYAPLMADLFARHLENSSFALPPETDVSRFSGRLRADPGRTPRDNGRRAPG